MLASTQWHWQMCCSPASVLVTAHGAGCYGGSFTSGDERQPAVCVLRQGFPRCQCRLSFASQLHNDQAAIEHTGRPSMISPPLDRHLLRALLHCSDGALLSKPARQRRLMAANTYTVIWKHYLQLFASHCTVHKCCCSAQAAALLLQPDWQRRLMAGALLVRRLRPCQQQASRGACTDIIKAAGPPIDP